MEGTTPRRCPRWLALRHLAPASVHASDYCRMPGKQLLVSAPIRRLWETAGAPGSRWEREFCAPYRGPTSFPFHCANLRRCLS